MDVLAPIFEIIVIIGLIAKISAISRRVDLLERKFREKSEESRDAFGVDTTRQNLNKILHAKLLTIVLHGVSFTHRRTEPVALNCR